ncbi:DnaD domain protein [Aerococcus sanguinicola]|uniref:DnaD domain protein n=2 Tax=Aerococcus TaxID=1375 RepID=A0A2I1MK54_9LACT|nr:DnaD domain protein [Aerococcus sanguinicola]MDK7051035.1 DnaD domain protein [Aerococcus sanguinicola]PKZ20507.1 DnaD domain protein [Aerococcus sanguinicola]
MKIEKYTVLRTLLLEMYHEIGITNEEMLFFIHLISFQQDNVEFPSFSMLMKRMGMTRDEILSLINSLVDRQYLRIDSKKNENNQQTEYYNLEFLYNRVDALVKQREAEEESKQTEDQEAEIFQVLETEFGRPLSPIEYQEVADWLHKDKFPTDMIFEAIKEAVLAQAYSLRYIDKVLMNWRRNPKQRNSKLRDQHSLSDLPPAPMKKIIKKDQE